MLNVYGAKPAGIQKKHRNEAYGKCNYCHGNRKINRDYIKWDKKLIAFVSDRQEELKKNMEEQLYDDVVLWQKKHKAPQKFPSKVK